MDFGLGHYCCCCYILRTDPLKKTSYNPEDGMRGGLKRTSLGIGSVRSRDKNRSRTWVMTPPDGAPLCMVDKAWRCLNLMDTNPP